MLPGEGKYVALWSVCQILYFFDQQWTTFNIEVWKKAMGQHRGAVSAWEAAGAKAEDEPETPPKPEPTDSVHNKGTFIGMGKTFETQYCRGYFGLHEAKLGSLKHSATNPEVAWQT